MRILFLLEDVLVNTIYAILIRFVKPASEQEAESLHNLTEQILLDPLNLFPKGKSHE